MHSVEKREWEKVWQRSVYSEAPAGWVTVQGGDSLLPQCQPGRPLCCQLLLKQNRGAGGGDTGSPPFSSSPSFNVLLPFLTPFPLRSQPASSFISCLVLISSTSAYARGRKNKTCVLLIHVLDDFSYGSVRWERNCCCCNFYYAVMSSAELALSISVMPEFRDSMFNKSKYQVTLLHFSTVLPLLPILLS